MEPIAEGIPIRLKADKGSKDRSRAHCKARTKAGGPCKAPPVEGGLCFFHAHPERLAELGRQGGKKNRCNTVSPDEIPQRELKSLSDVVALLDETINQVRRRQIEHRAPNAIGTCPPSP